MGRKQNDAVYSFNGETLLEGYKNNFESKTAKEIIEHESREERVDKNGGKQKKKGFFGIKTCKFLRRLQNRCKNMEAELAICYRTAANGL